MCVFVYMCTGEGLDEVAKVFNKHANKGSINDCDASGWTPLPHAAANNHVTTAEFLVSVGAQVNHACHYGDKRYGPTPLHLAAARGHLDMVKYLVRVGADVDNSNSDMRIIFGDTPLGDHATILL